MNNAQIVKASLKNFFVSSPKDIFSLLLKIEEGGERERNTNWLPPTLPNWGSPTRAQTCNLDTWPDWRENPQLFGSWDNASTNSTASARAINSPFDELVQMHKTEQFKSLSSYRTFLFFLDYLFIIFRERERAGEREGEKHQCVVASHMAPLGARPTTQACAPTGNRTSDPLARSLCSIHWATPVREVIEHFYHCKSSLVSSINLGHMF